MIRRMRSFLAVCLVWAIVFGVMFVGCSDDSDSEGETGNEKGVVLDGVTGATPDVDGAIVTSQGHGSAWGKPNCLTCHTGLETSPHGDNMAVYTIAECARCHGNNGAPALPLKVGSVEHTVADCAQSGCHGIPSSHLGDGLSMPNDCLACHKYEPATEGDCGITESYDVVVVGGGCGGLSAAALLTQNDLSVIVLERMHRAGGYMVNYQRGEYRIEASLHAIDGLDIAAHPSEPRANGVNVGLFTRLGLIDEDPSLSKVTFARAPSMYRIVTAEDEDEIVVPTDVGEYKAMLIEKFPTQEKGITALFAELAQVDRLLTLVSKYQNDGKDIFQNPADMAAVGLEAASKGLSGALTKLLGYSNKTLTQFLEQHIDDPKLISVFSQLHWFGGAHPDELAAVLFLYMWNSFHVGGFSYPVGGSQAISDGLTEIIEEHGGIVRTNSLVTKIDVEDNLATRVRTEDGTCYNARYVVSNANAPDTFLKLIGEEHLPTNKPNSPFHPDRLEQGNENSLEVGPSYFQTCLGVNRDYSPEFEGSNELWIGDLYDHADGWDAAESCDIERLPLTIVNYTMLDPGNAPAGKNVICVYTQLMIECEDLWRSNIDHATYDEFKHDVGRTIVDRIEEYLPEISAHVEVFEVGTPVTMKQFSLNPKGSIFGWRNIPSQSMDKRMPHQTPFGNMMIAGHWTYPGTGQSAVVTSGYMAARKILSKEGL